MDRRRRPTPLTIRTSFEATRLGGRCLAEAYERLVPITRRCLYSFQGMALDQNAVPTMRRDERA